MVASERAATAGITTDVLHRTGICVIRFFAIIFKLKSARTRQAKRSSHARISNFIV